MLCSVIARCLQPTSLWRKSVVWVAIDHVTGSLNELSTSSLGALVAEVDGHDPTRDELDQTLESLERTWKAVSFAEADVYVVAGAFWVHNSSSTLMQRARRSGARTGVLIYDLIPALHPEFCEAALTTAFSRQLVEILHFTDVAFTISNHVKSDLERFIAENGLPTVPVTAIPLVAHFEQVEARTSEIPRSIRKIISQEYVLSVGTVEIRKNHNFLIQVWRRLIAELGRDRVPRLVIVGRRGWRVDDLYAQLESTEFLDGHVEVLEDISSPDLSILYERCLFTAFVSFVEGWGLPVGESLSFGKLCVAARTSSVPEIGGALPVYVDPFNATEGTDVFARLITDRAYLSERTAAIAQSFKARTWEDYTSDLLQSFADIPADGRQDYAAVQVPDATWTSLGEDANGSYEPATAMAGLICTEGWHPREHWGRWSSADQAYVEFRTTPLAVLTVVLRLALPPWLTDHGVRIADDHGRVRTYHRVPPQGSLVQFQTLADERGVVRLCLETLGSAIKHPSDPRDLFVGVSQILVYNTGDTVSYLRGVEELSFAALGILRQ